MSRRRRRAKARAVRLGSTWSKVLRRRARASGGRRVASAATAAVTLTAAGASVAAAEQGLAAGTVGAARVTTGVAGERCTGPSSPSPIVNVGSTSFFTADDGRRGRELWRSDGTRRGTRLVRAISHDADDVGPQELTAAGNLLFFTVDDGIHGRELWRSDGTRAGTVLVKDIRPLGVESAPSQLIAVGDTLFFTADDGVHGQALWKSDGTAAGTVLVKDVQIATGDYLNPPPPMTSFEGTLFFSADDGVHGPELWKSDGSEVGTVLVKDINPGAARELSERTHGRRLDAFLQRSPSTPLAKNCGRPTELRLERSSSRICSRITTTLSIPRNLTAVGGTLFYTVQSTRGADGLWTSDGTEVGTVLVNGFSDYANTNNLTDVAGTLFFATNDGVQGRELWKSDGTTTGTMLVKDINLTGSYGYGRSSSPSDLTAVEGRLFFTADDGRRGRELWKSDGTMRGTVLVKNIKRGAGSSEPSSLASAESTLYFAADNGARGSELWKSDGSRTGTVLVKDINRRSHPCDAASSAGENRSDANQDPAQRDVAKPRRVR